MSYNKSFFWSLLALIGMAVGCGTKSESGMCELRCGNSIIGSELHHQITSISTDMDFTCGGSGSAINPEVAVFRVDDTDVVDSLLGGSGEATRPTPGITVTPNVVGTLDSCSTHPTNGIVTQLAGGRCSVDPDTVHGITTPKSDWCSDTCGVATFQFIPFCAGVGVTDSAEISAFSGALNSLVHFNEGAKGALLIKYE